MWRWKCCVTGLSSATRRRPRTLPPIRSSAGSWRVCRYPRRHALMNEVLTRDILRKVRQIEIRTNRIVADSLAGHYHSVFKGRGMDFDEVREYVPGDEVRTIDWNVTARAGRPFIKKFAEERELTLLLLVDVSASGHFGSGIQSKRDVAAELACVLALSATRNNDK